MRRHILDNPVTYYAIFLSVQYLPTGLCHWLGKVVALLIYSFSHKDREGLAFNISLALNRSPNDPAVRKRVRQVFINYGRYMVDFFLMPQLSVRKAKMYFAHIQGEEILQSALARGRGAILLSPHLGNWEFGGVMLRHSEYPLAVVALAHNVSSTNTLVNRLRKENGIKIIEVDQSPFSGVEILRHLRNNGVVAMIGDKNFFGRGLPTTFFGKEVIFPLGPVLMAMKSGALIPAF
ncbi:MAG: hypothetical protein HKM90_11075, partial [Desulfobacteraceae bacterium]|nr:hypothetical protein [Desulfobacteraceae bacterium]